MSVGPSPQESDLHRESNHDNLTGLLNRRGLSESLHSLIEQKPGDFALVILDLDGLKKINDTQGHLSGDSLLQRAGAVLQETIRQDSLNLNRKEIDIASRGRTARTGGDEFVILFTGINNAEDLAAATGRLNDRFNKVGMEVSMGGQIHEPGMTESDLVGAADAAMYEDKERRKLEKYSPEQLSAAKHIGAIAAEHEIDLRDIPILLPHLND